MPPASSVLECATGMEVRNLFINKQGQLRSWWRAGLFTLALQVCAPLFKVSSDVVAGMILGPIDGRALRMIIAGLAFFSSATLVGWACGAVFEHLGFRSVGWWPHRGWLKNLALGSLIGAASLLLAAGITATTRGIRFSFNPGPATAIGRTAVVTLIVFVVAAAAEEALFRGYPLQTFTRAKLAWLGVVLSSLSFAIAHLINPNVAPGFTFINTSIAGVWFAVAYVRTRSLWFPLGLHWSWNWTQAALLGIPVSGITGIAPAPLLHGMNAGPNWLTGGAYGLEGGLAGTAALVVSTIVVWRTKLVSTAEDPSSQSQVASAAATQ